MCYLTALGGKKTLKRVRQTNRQREITGLGSSVGPRGGPEPVKVLFQRFKILKSQSLPELLSDILLCPLISATCSSNKWVCNKQVYEFAIKKFADKFTAKWEFWTEQDSFIQTSLQSSVCCHGDGLMFEKIPSTPQRMFFTDQQLKSVILRSLLLFSLCK